MKNIVSGFVSDYGLARPICLLGCCLLAPVECTVAEENPQPHIVGHNLFEFQPSNVGAVGHASALKSSPPAIVLSGITTVFGRKQVVVRLLDPGTKKESSCLLAEGEGHGPIKVLNVDVAKCCATFENSGSVQTISLSRANSGPDEIGFSSTAALNPKSPKALLPAPQQIAPAVNGPIQAKTPEQQAEYAIKRRIMCELILARGTPERAELIQSIAEDMPSLVPAPSAPRHPRRTFKTQSEPIQ